MCSVFIRLNCGKSPFKISKLFLIVGSYFTVESFRFRSDEYLSSHSIDDDDDLSMQDDDDCNSSESASDVRDKADDTTNRQPTTEVKVLGRKRQSLKLNELKSEDKVAEEKYSVKKEEVKQDDRMTKRRSIPYEETESRSQDGIRAGNTKSP